MSEPARATPVAPSLAQALTLLTTGSAAPPGDGPTHLVVVRTLRDVEGLGPLLARSPDGVVVLADAGRPWRRPGTRAMVRSVRALASDHDRAPTTTYLLWPSATAPAYAVPLAARHAFTWLRRSGLLRGGHGPVTRMLHRRRAFDAVLWRRCPGALMVLPAR